jgi:hypothetical protein
MPLVGRLLSGAARESVAFLNPFRTMNKLKRLPEAGRLAAGMMASNNKVLSNPNIRKLMRSRESGLDSSVSKVLGDTPDWHKSLVELRKARTDSGKLFRRTLAYQRRFGELPTDTLRHVNGRTFY